ncbi:MAG: hypothetical protein H6579_11020 [Chitinophagales bacterium]|nr:hypothetical protein [Bacteroidota bacterium]MCB9257651.1 hypothetical protein [Chitinophagales bacterium]
MTKRLLNISLLFVSAYVMVHMLYLSINYLAALSIDMPNVHFYFTTIYFDYKEYFHEWTRFKVVMVYGLPSFFMLFSAFIYWVVLNRIGSEQAKSRIFLVWLILISLAFFIADIISAPYFKRTLSIVFDWYYIKRETTFAFSLAILPVIPIIAYYAQRPFIKLADSRSQLKSKLARVKFLSSNILMAFFIGAALFSLGVLIVPTYEFKYFLQHDFIRLGVIFLILLFVLIFGYRKNYVTINKGGSMESIDLAQFTSMSVIIILVYLIFTLA